ncbi:DUF4082 domain-containing protein [Phycicoccus sp. CSK15P-2]|uniref:DUF4082 domain-containing protein n=1 Tax=Phycicoccus sp. CSK15P-2 TaxID=2807627 RepID=UPI0019510D08|nr:DUF4082 domain-containing protein [Phycicoccus sp. CSK15P-2]MBM6402962.1 DUF4082 domain-containing protein [Phycicoccus sp. CSK15P-2]
MNRGRLQHLIDPTRAANPEEIYGLWEGIAEYVAQGRFIARQTGGSLWAVPPTMQWETSMPADTRRLDVMTYNPGSSTSEVKVVELKSSWVESASDAWVQATDYAEAIGENSDHPADVWDLTGKYTDSFYRGKRCSEGDPNKVDGWRYEVHAPIEGVIMIDRTAVRCQKRQVSEEEIEAQEKCEMAMELAEDGQDIPAGKMPSGSDCNGNGVADYVDVSKYAHDGDVEHRKAPTTKPRQTWHTDIKEIVTQESLHLISRQLINLTTKLGTQAAQKVLDVTARAMFSASAKITEEALVRELMRELEGVVIESSVRSLVGSGASAGLRHAAIDGTIRIVERGGEKFIQRAITEGMARKLAGLLERYAIRIGLSTTANFIPLLGQIIMLVVDVYFTVELILDIADLLGFNLFGDPHLVTMDRRFYDLQSVGEFVLARTAAGSVVQGRFVAASSNVSVMGTAAFGAGEDRVELVGSAALLNGEPLSLDGFMVTDGGLAIAHVRGVWAISGPDGLTMTGRSAENLRIVAPEGVTSAGLLGDNDGNAANDLALRDGTVLNAASDLSVLHGRFADAWRVDAEEALFTYENGESTETFTDRSFPENIVTLGDFSPSQIDLANASCLDAGVASGAPMEACVLDTLVTSDASFAAAAAATPSVIDPAQVGFNEDGVLEQNYDGAVPVSLQSKTTVQLDDSSRGAGPFFDDAPYKFGVLSIPRHDTAQLDARVVVLGSPSADHELAVNVDGATGAMFSLNDSGVVLSGPPGTDISIDGVGVTPAGTAYTAYSITVPLPHVGDALKAQFGTRNVHAISGSGLAVDSLRVALNAPDPDVAEGLALPFVASPDLGEGLGTIETPGAADEYQFTIDAEAANAPVLVETSAAPAVRAELLNDDTGKVVEPTDRNNHLLYEALSAGTYRLSVTGKQGPVDTYELPVMAVEPEEFDLEIGQKIEPGKIGGVATPGAGSQETTASKDVYSFTVPEGGRTVVFDGAGAVLWDTASQVVDESGKSYGNVYGHHEYQLPAGTYQLIVGRAGTTGTYSVDTFVKPADDEFDLEIGQKIEPGKIGGVATPGAGSQETTASKDVYSFIVPEGGRTVVFDGAGGVLWDTASTVVDESGKSYGNVYGHNEYQLPAGTYQLVVGRAGMTGDYSIDTFVKPADDEFDLEIGQKIEPGKIGGVAAPGAGSQETTASKDVYSFIVPEGGRTVVFDGAGGVLWDTASQVVDAAGKSYGSVYGHNEYELPAGEYRLVVGRAGMTGTYSVETQARPLPEHFDLEIGQKIEPGKIGGVAAEGAGVQETTASKDVYSFTVPEGGRTVVFDGAGAVLWSTASAVVDESGKSYGNVYGHHEYQLPAGTYQLIVGRAGTTGTYSVDTFVKPADDEFDLEIGQKIEPGKIGGVATPGAGSQETTASKDVYSFIVPEGGRTVVFDGAGGVLWDTASTVVDESGKSYGNVYGHHEYQLPAGTYQLVVGRAGMTGDYSIDTFVKPADDEFDLEIGQKIEPGKIGGETAPGAGRLETTASKDVYSFTVPEGGRTVVLDGWGNALGGSKVVDASGKSYGEVYSKRVYELPAGAYRIVVAREGFVGDYSIDTFVKPADDEFDLEIGQKIEPGKIGGETAPGAGRLETTASKDVYSFTVPEGGRTVVLDGWGNALGGSKVIDASGKSYGEVYSKRVYELPAGAYRIVVAREGFVGDYTIDTSVEPDPNAPVTCPCGVWDASTPSTAREASDSNAVNLGVRFVADAPGVVSGVRFFKQPGNTGAHVGSLWTASGQLLATGEFTDESESGWQTLLFESPVTISADTTYVASYHTNVGHYSYTQGGMSEARTRGPLTALAGGGVYTYQAGNAFPSSSWSSSNYWVDVVFEPTAG